MPRTVLALTLSLLALSLAACGGSSTTAPDAAAPPAATVAAAPANTEAPVATEAPTVDANAAHAMGETVDIGNGATMTVESVTKNADGELVFVVAVDNSAGKEPINVSSAISFDAKDSTGNKGTYAIQMSPPAGANTPLDGTVAPGDKLRGYLGFGGLGTGVKLYYAPSLIDSARITWDAGQ